MTTGLSARQRAVKRAFDLVVASVGLLVTWPVIVVAALIARAETGESGLFRQVRIGRDRQPFEILKIRTMRTDPAITTTVTVDGDPRITRWGALFRRTKIDELPQLLNVLRGDMSIVGPRPDVPGHYDGLTGPDLIILTVRPGITGAAALRFADEELLLAAHPRPDDFNRDTLLPQRVAADREHIEHLSLRADIAIVAMTIVALLTGRRTVASERLGRDQSLTTANHPAPPRPHA